MNDYCKEFVLECAKLDIDGYTKKQIIEFGATEEIADLGIKINIYLTKKELEVEING